MLGSSAATRENSFTHESAAAGAVIKTTKNNNNKNCCRRFSDEQIKSLESTFKQENKLEPRKKLEMARELGLHPRQVAIWFQNRRARWKSKQVEQDYTNLKADFDNLTHRFESLKKEKHDLLHQLSNLCSQVNEGSKLDLDYSGCGSPLEQAIYSDEADDPSRNMVSSEDIRHENNYHSCSNWWDIWS